MTDDEQPKNVTIRPGIVEMQHPHIGKDGLIRWGSKRYRVDDEGHPVEVSPVVSHPVEVTDANKMLGCTCGGADSGDCQCGDYSERG